MDKGRVKPTDTEFPPGHTPRYVSTPSGMIDSYECSCGWKSGPYYDGAEYAWTDWKRHVEYEMRKEETRMFSEEQLARYRRHVDDGGWIAVDLDGTWAEYHGWTAVTEFGKPIDAMTQRVRAWLDLGLEVRVFTARFVPGGYDGVSEEEFQRAIGDWTEPLVGVRLKATCIKDFRMLEQWDDRAVQVVPNTGLTLLEYATKSAGAEEAAERSALRGAP